MKKFKEYIVESSLSRIIQHIEKNSNFGVISSFRGENTDKQNEESYKELVSLVRKMGYGYIALKGGYQEEEGFVNEKSLFIPNISKEEMIDLGKKYGQHSVIVKDKGSFEMIGTNEDAGIGTVIEKFDTTKGKNLSLDNGGEIFKQFFSQLVKGSHSGRKFQFKSETFKMEEKIETSMYYYAKHGPQWRTIYESK